MRAQIIGTGSCLPEKIVTNDFLSTIFSIFLLLTFLLVCINYMLVIHFCQYRFCDLPTFLYCNFFNTVL